MGQQTLSQVLEGWNGYNESIINAIQPLTAEQLAWRPQEGFLSVGELARHISLGRLSWFMRMDAPGSAALVELIDVWEDDSDGNRDIVEAAVAIAGNAAELVRWLERSWQMIDQTLSAWTVDDLSVSYRHVWNGQTWAPTRQWTIWRILSHDLHHGGELSLMLGLQGIEAFELSGLFGHIILPPPAAVGS